MTAANLPKKGPGRPKGSSNKITKNIKTAIEEAFDKAGGVDYLVGLATSDPKTFCTLVGKVIPTTIIGDEDNPLVHVVTRRVVRPDN